MADDVVQIGSAGAVDVPWLLRADQHVPESWVRRCVSLDEYLMARMGGETVGFLRYSMFWGQVPFMDMIHVDAGHRRRGLGSAMFHAWQEQMRSRGASVLMTSSMEDEPEPQAWHRRNGFEPSGALTFGPVQQTPELFFIKSL
jgi:ribosomal protein S18 acetylase RimI-like enzyme